MSTKYTVGHNSMERSGKLTAVCTTQHTITYDQLQVCIVYMQQVKSLMLASQQLLAQRVTCSPGQKVDRAGMEDHNIAA